MTRKLLMLFCLLVLIIMLWGTIQASLYQNIGAAIEELGPHPWFQVTIYDTYFAFLVIYFWIAYKETSWAARLIWFVAVMGLGNFAIAFYLILQLRKMDAHESMESLLRRGLPGK